MIAIFNYDNYLDNPIAQYCVIDQLSKKEKPTIYTLDDLMPDIMKLHHAKESYENVYIKKNKKSLPSFIGDQIRLYYSLQNDNYLYCDADVFIPDEYYNEIWKNKNCVYYGELNHREINNGTFFCSDKDCKFNEYYFNLYETKDLKDVTNVNVYFKYPYQLDYEKKKAGDMNLLNIPVKHFILSRMYSFKKIYEKSSERFLDTIYYTFENDLKTVYKKAPKNLIWMIGKKADPIDTLFYSNAKVLAFQWNTLEYKYISHDTQFNLFKDQLEYTLGKKLKFVEF